MNITFVPNNIINEGFADRCSPFNHCDKVIGPDGTIYDTAQIIALVNNACDELTKMTKGLINEYLVALPIVYTFQVQTMATDTKYIYINPGFVLELVKCCGDTVIGIAFVILHEVYHNLYLHHEREAANPSKFSNHDKANDAQDYEINWIIEHTFPDMRSEIEVDPDDPDDSPFEEDGVTRKQIMSGVTKTCHGLIDDKFGGMAWEDIYDLLPESKPSKEEKEDDEINISLSPDFKDGYKDGWEEAIRELRAKGLVESVKITDNVIFSIMKLLEASTGSKEYDAGYQAGYSAAMEKLLAIMNPQAGGGGQMPQGGPTIKIEKIDGLTPLKPINPPAQPEGEGQSNVDNPNTPVDMPNSNNSQSDNSKKSNSSSQSNNNSSSNNQNGSSGSGKDSSIGDSEQNVGNNGDQNQPGTDTQDGTEDGAISQDGQDGKDAINGQKPAPRKPMVNPAPTGNSVNQDPGTTSQEQLDDILRKGESTVKVGIADGTFTGKTGDFGNNSRHNISEGEGDDIRKRAGIEDGQGDERSTGKVKNPFDSSNVKKIIETIDKLSKIGNQGGRGRGPADAIIDKMIDVLSPKINWREEMKKRLDACFMKLADAGWNKKPLSYDVYSRFDDWEGEGTENLVIMIDTSGSILSDDYLLQVIREFNELGKEVEPANIDIVLFCDGVYWHQEFDLSSKIPDLRPFFKHNVQSGGTTYMECFSYIQKYYEKEGKQFACCIIFTDCDVTTATLPKKTQLTWDPGTKHDDDSKLLWFILNDDDEKVELPYGGIIQMSHKDFLKTITLPESMQIINKLNIPRRSIMTNNKNINEAFKKISVQKAELGEEPAVVPAETPADSTAEVPVAPKKAPRKRLYDPLQRRLELIRAYAEETGIDEVKAKIKAWIKSNTNLSVDSWSESYNDIDPIENDLLINLRKNKDLVLKGAALNNIPNYILFGMVPGNLEVGNNKELTKLPLALLTASVGRDFICTNMPNLRSLEGGPLSVRGNYIVMKCNRLETLDGAPMRHNAFKGYFLTDSDRFTDDDFYDTVENGGVMRTGNDIVEESMNTKQRVNRLIESRIALGKYYNSLNEAFSSRILSRLARIPENRQALETMKTMKVFWSEIPDEIITPVYGSVTKVIQARRVVNKDTSKFGITICCDKNDHINVIGTGDNQADWKGNTWLYLAPNIMTLIKERLELVKTAMSGYRQDDDVKEAQQTLDKLGINWQKTDIQKLRMPYDKNDLNFPHLYLIPEYCSRSYVIKGMDDNKSVASKDPEFARNFSYRSQEARRKELANTRREAISGSFMGGNLANGPAAKRYMRDMIDDDVIARVSNAYRTNRGISRALDGMKSSVESLYNKVKTELFKANRESLISERAFAMIYVRVMRSTYSTFIKEINEEKERINGLANSEESYFKKLSGMSDENLDMKDIKNKTWDKSETIWNTTNKPYKSAASWYKLYMITIKTFAEVLGKLAAAKRGDSAAIEDYAEKLSDQLIDKNYALDDEFNSVRM